LISDSLGLGTLSVGAPYFNPTFDLSMIPLFALLALGIHSKWKRGKLGDAQRILLLTLVVSAVIAVGLVYGIYSHGKLLTPVAATLGVWIILSSLIDPIDRWRRKLSMPRSVIGMTIAHIGLGLAVISVTTVESFTIERDVAMAPGQQVNVGGWDFRFDGVRPIQGPNYEGTGSSVTVTRNGSPVTVLYPEKREFYVQRQETTQAAIEMHRGSNLFIALGDDLGAGKWSLRFQIRPLVNLVWLGAFIMAVGGAVAASDRRYRLAKVAEPAVAGASSPTRPTEQPG
jgi:cytochrome c-type biogenesis protein CcmF